MDMLCKRELESERRAAALRSRPSSNVFIIGDLASEETPLAHGTEVDLLCRFNRIYWDIHYKIQNLTFILNRYRACSQHPKI